jgi:hypothetical protein
MAISFMLTLSPLLMIELACAVCTSSAAGAQVVAVAPQGELYYVDEHQLYAESSGSSPVTFVLELGLGSALSTWKPLQAELASRGRVISYLRAGNGRSEVGPLSEWATRT